MQVSEFKILDLLEVVGALAFFIYGMKLMSEGIQRAAGSQLRNILRTMTKNRYLGVFTGFLVTALVQSSSATTVMTVSFVNAGLLSLVESAGVMMGANIGTTITGWLVSVLGFKIKLSTYSLPLFAIGLPMLFSSRGRFKYWGEFIIGFAILFMGLGELKETVPDLSSNAEWFNWLKGFTEWGVFSRILFVLVGSVVTIIVQSSSAAMAITLTMCAQGWLSFETAAAMILGENIGTTITAEFASLVGNANAKRSARIHSMFNIIGVTWMVLLLPLYLPILSNFIQHVMGGSDPYLAEGMPIGLSAFHTAFNLTNVLLLLGFVPLLIRAAVWSVKAKDDEDEARLKYISTAVITPELATIELQKEAAHFGEVVSRMSGFLRKLINDTKEKKRKKILKRMRKYEEITDAMEIEITEYITKLSNQELTPQTSLRLRSILNVCNDLERIGDVYYQIAKTMEKKIEENTYFFPEQTQSLNQMIDLIDKAFSIMVDNLSAPNYNKVDKKEALQVEAEIDTFRDHLRELNQSRLGEMEYNVKSSMVFNTIFSSLEKVGNHIVNVTEAVVGEI
ncbi:MAG: Na/Pi cotransporter family protein [Bacteroidota bacterium]